MSTEAIIRIAETFARHLGLTLSTVSTYAANDGKWLSGLKTGSSCTLRKAAVVTCWFSENWPADLEWPRDVPRPAIQKKEKAA
ncbi:hypothetical protein [Pseudogemmobacter blasticus]|uniref:DNA-binding protein n=1 Tax=Fuscovulum blasticum DSM 2131 TaxID=1188250 RepID=A0A2T4JDJ4_FUSBL|nr:hypothetical protein [Fuscovulum blasticum]PTE15966.1 hypothetical protein C5F44_02700 [Fuscovulum blasticum DSM 2131]